eukprot:TRINITY_DN139_c1_g1_i1.p1 TRINITY_DN139_c1_g1~~TRINITY_DN139_c1_g1_i1.p1  ORF type:complete len:1175 (-),score=122.48 TRINITY_DN139_c1_g1_i1:274-3798(-)
MLSVKYIQIQTQNQFIMSFTSSEEDLEPAPLSAIPVVFRVQPHQQATRHPQFEFQHNVNMDLSLPPNDPEPIPSKKPKDMSAPRGIRENLKRMVYMTNLLERRQGYKSRPPPKRMPAPRSMSPQVYQKPPLYQFPSLSLGNLRGLKRQKGHSSEPAKKEDTNLRLAHHSTDRIMAFSERFGKIIKQSRRDSSKQALKKGAGSIVRQSPKNIIQIKEPPRISLVDQKYLLLQKAGKGSLIEPYDRFIYQILSKGKEDFDQAGERIKGKSIYANAMKELNSTLIKQRQSAKTFGEETLFTPVFLRSLCKKLDDTRWLQLYLIKILYKKPLLGRIKDLFALRIKLENAKIEYKAAFKKYIKEKFRLKKLQEKTKPTAKPFLCGTATSKSIRRPPKKALGEKVEQVNIEELKLKASMVHDKIEKFQTKLSFEVLRFESLVKNERETYLNLVLSNANKALYHFFMGAWFHYVKVKREKRELVDLAKAKVERVLLTNIVLSWRKLKPVRDERREKLEIARERIREKKARKTLKALSLYSAMKRRQEFLNSIVEEYNERRLKAKSMYLWRYYVIYNVQVKKRARSLVKKEGQQVPRADRMVLEKEFRKKIAKAKDQVLSKAKITLQNEYKVEKVVCVKEVKKTEQKKVEQTATEKVHAALFRYQTWGREIRKPREHLRLVMPIQVMPNIELVRKHAKSVLRYIREDNLVQRPKESVTLWKKSRIFAKWKRGYSLKVLEEDLEILRALVSWKRFLSELKECVLHSKDREREAQNEHYLKLGYRVFQRWRKHFSEEKAANERKILLFRLRMALHGWKKYVSLKICRFNKMKKANAYFDKMVKHAFIQKLQKITKDKSNCRKYRQRSVFLRWHRKQQNRRLLKRVFKSAVTSYIQRRKAERRRILKGKFQKWKAATIDSPEVLKEREKLSLAKLYYSTHSLTTKFTKWKKLAKTQKALKIIATSIHERVLRPAYTKWITLTENYLEGVLHIRQSRAKSLLMKGFATLKRDFLFNKLAKLFCQRKIMQEWLNYTKDGRFNEPMKHYSEILKRKTFVGFRLALKEKLERQKANIIGNEVKIRHKLKVKKAALISMAEYSMQRKKKDIIMQTVGEFRGICLLRKSMLGLLRNAENKRKKRISINKALAHFEKVRKNKEEIKRMINEFSRSEYGLTKVKFQGHKILRA